MLTCGKTRDFGRWFSVARDFTEGFYGTQRWKDTRDTYMLMGQGLCEPCLDEGRYTIAEIVHHKVHLTPDNINDPSITLNFDNLQRVCRDCHAKAHPEIYGSETECKMRVGFDADGNLVRLENTDER